MSDNAKVWTLYVHICPDNRKYVGITSRSLQCRWGLHGEGYKHQKFYDAIQKFGWENIEHKIIFEQLTLYQASKLEMDYIKKYDSYVNGYNESTGGETYFNCIPVICINDQKKFDNAYEASKYYNIPTGTIKSNCCEHIMSYRYDDIGRYYWFDYYKEGKEYNIQDYIIKYAKRPIICLDDQTVYVNPAEISRVFNVFANAVARVCKHKCSDTKGHHYMFYEEYLHNGDTIKRNKRVKPILLLNTGEIFPSAIQASKKIGISSSAISKQCRNGGGCCGKIYNFPAIWCYHDDYKNNLEQILQKKILGNDGSRLLWCETNKTFYVSVIEMAEMLNISIDSIRGCIYGKQQYANDIYHNKYIVKVVDQTIENYLKAFHTKTDSVFNYTKSA